ncbi:hypothetical protein P9112_000750 [Eukaryota sp. TZLM1-RC]
MDSDQPPLKRQKVDEPEKTAVEKRPTSIYVTGLPLDTDIDEVAQYFSKAGVIRKSEETHEPVIKLYRNEDGSLKGDAKIIYLRPESVSLATTLLDDSLFRPSLPTISVSPASREPEGEKNTMDEGTSKSMNISTISARERRRRFKKQYQKALGWEESSEPPPSTRTVVLRNMFTIQEMETEAGLTSELRADVHEECIKFGHVEKVSIFSNNPEGIVTVRFKERACAVDCVHVFNGRIYDGKVVIADLWDGKEKFKIKDKDDLERFESYQD